MEVWFNSVNACTASPTKRFSFIGHLFTGTSFLDINNLNNVHGGKFPRRASRNPIMFAETCSSYRKNYQPESENAAQVVS